MRRLRPWALLLLLYPSVCAAEPVRSAAPGPGALPADLWRDVRALPTRENVWWLLGGAAATLGARAIEDPERAARTLNQPLIDELADAGNIWGDVRVQGTLALGLWGVGSLADGGEAAALGYDMTRALLLTYGAVSGLKVAVDRERPNGERYSFPSGHTASAFATAGVLSRRYGGWAGGAGVGLASLAAFGRMEDLKHYASDCVAGATIGWICGRNAARGDAADQSAWRVVPWGRGLAVAGRF